MIGKISGSERDGKKGGVAMIAFINSFLSYLLLFVIMAAIAGTGIFLGIVMRKKKNLSQAAEQETEEPQQ
ncbi:MAG: hypothetical protein ACI4EQ_01190 [Lachnospiraceae bacterium]